MQISTARHWVLGFVLKRTTSPAEKFTATSRSETGIGRWKGAWGRQLTPHSEARRRQHPPASARDRTTRDLEGAAPPRRVWRAKICEAPGTPHRTRRRPERPPGWAPRGALPRGLGVGSHPSAAKTRPCPCAEADSSRPRDRGPRARRGGANSRESQAPAQPVSAAGGRPRRALLPPSAPLPLSFLSPTPLPLRAAGKPVTALSPPSLEPHRLFSAVDDPSLAGAFASLASQRNARWRHD
jgi:hypothetical protein